MIYWFCHQWTKITKIIILVRWHPNKLLLGCTYHHQNSQVLIFSLNIKLLRFAVFYAFSRACNNFILNKITVPLVQNKQWKNSGKTANKLNLQATLHMVKKSCKGSDTGRFLDCFSASKGTSLSSVILILASAVASTLSEDKSRWLFFALFFFPQLEFDFVIVGCSVIMKLQRWTKSYQFWMQKIIFCMKTFCIENEYKLTYHKFEKR